MDSISKRKNRILALETTGMIASVAFAEFDENFDLPIRTIEKQSEEQRNHLTELMPLIRDVLSEANLTLSEIDAIAVSAGPGSFTGMRIGISTARALAQVEGIPIISVPTLDAYVFVQEEPSDISARELVCPIFDARLSQLYAGVYSFASCVNDDVLDTFLPGGAYLPAEYFNKLTEIAKDWSSESQLKSIVFFGDGIAAFSKEISDWCAEISAIEQLDSTEILFDKNAYLKASHVARWAFYYGETEEYSKLEPIYIRKAEAQRKLDEGLLKPHV